MQVRNVICVAKHTRATLERIQVISAGQLSSMDKAVQAQLLRASQVNRHFVVISYEHWLNLFTCTCYLL